MEFPKTILIDNAVYCNLKCSMCDYVHMKRKKQLLDIALYKKMIDEIADKAPSTRVWEIFVGDPCCCPDMDNRISYAKAQGLTDVVLNTNGNALHTRLSRRFIEAGLDIMYIGVDATSQEVYSKIRVGGRLAKVITNVLSYRDLLTKIGNGKQKLFVQFLLCEENKHQKEEFITFWKAQGIDVKVRTKVSWGGIVAAPNLSAETKRIACKWGKETMVICADGRVCLCAVDAHCAVDCGDVSKNTLEYIWNDKLAEYRRFHDENKFDCLPEFCNKCLDWQAGMCEYNPEV